MPNWIDVLNELEECSVSPLDQVRKKYLKELGNLTGRNVIAYYSGFLDRSPDVTNVEVNDSDINGLMTVINHMDRSKGLDLILHTPGGGLAATECIVNYLKSMFGNNIRAIVPQIAMSAGTMIACSCSSIVMGKQSSIGPIDPQMRGLPAQGVIDEFKHAVGDAADMPHSIPMWTTIIGKYHPTFIGECVNAVEMSKQIVTDWLSENMFSTLQEPQRSIKAKQVAEKLSDHDDSKMHDRHIGKEKAKQIGLVIDDLEADNQFQDLVLTVHHTFMHTINKSSATKIIQNDNGVCVISTYNNHK